MESIETVQDIQLRYT